MLKRILKLVMFFVGTVFAFIPAFGVHQGLLSNANEQGDEIVSSIASSMLSHAENNLNSSLNMLSELVLLGVTTCNKHDVAEMRRAVYSQFWVKRVGIVSKDGQMLCDHLGEPHKFTEITGHVSSDHDNIVFQTVRDAADAPAQTMVTWRLDSEHSLGAIMPGSALAHDVIPENMRNKSVGLVSLTDGTLLYMAPDERVARAELPFDDQTFTSVSKSELFPFKVTALVPFGVVWAGVADLYSKSLIIAGIIGLVLWLLMIYALRPRKARTNEIEEAIEAGEFIPFYQPTFDMQTGALRGCEVLIRWRKPDGSILPPGAFIGLAEATGLAIPMTQSLMENIVYEMEDLHEARPDLKIGINLFDDHFENLDIVTDIKNIFGPSKIAYTQLMFEVTERQPLNDIERARIVIRNMRSLGCKVALDDAGTGHGGLAYLQQLGLDVIKIDKLFIDAIGTDSLSAPIVDSLINLSESLGMDVIAEGVEDALQVEYLRSKGVSLAQGYLFAKPLPGEVYKRLIERMVPLSKSPEQRRRASLKETPEKRAQAA